MFSENQRSSKKIYQKLRCVDRKHNRPSKIPIKLIFE